MREDGVADGGGTVHDDDDQESLNGGPTSSHGEADGGPFGVPIRGNKVPPPLPPPIHTQAGR